jgi:hypothetical protein
MNWWWELRLSDRHVITSRRRDVAACVSGRARFWEEPNGNSESCLAYSFAGWHQSLVTAAFLFFRRDRRKEREGEREREIVPSSGRDKLQSSHRLRHAWLDCGRRACRSLACTGEQGDHDRESIIDENATRKNSITGGRSGYFLRCLVRAPAAALSIFQRVVARRDYSRCTGCSTMHLVTWNSRVIGRFDCVVKVATPADTRARTRLKSVRAAPRSLTFN